MMVFIKYTTKTAIWEKAKFSRKLSDAENHGLLRLCRSKQYFLRIVDDKIWGTNIQLFDKQITVQYTGYKQLGLWLPGANLQLF